MNVRIKGTISSGEISVQHNDGADCAIIGLEQKFAGFNADDLRALIAVLEVALNAVRGRT